MNQIKIGEHEFNIRVKVGVFETVLLLSGKELIPFMSENFGNMTQYITVLLIAGMECHREYVNGPEIDQDKIRRIVRTEGELKHAEQLAKIYSEFLGVGEPVPPTKEKPAKAAISHGKQFKNTGSEG